MSTEVLFAIQDVLPGKLNALVKNIMSQMAIDDPNEAVRRINAGEWVVKISNLLKRIATVTAGSAQRFVAAEHLKEANVGWTGDNFKRLFLNKVEENVPEINLAVSRLERASLDTPILAELGDNAEVSLVYLFGLLKKQANGEDGILLTNGYANIFYTRDDEGVLWAVGAGWRSCYRCWRVEARSVGDPCRWGDGCQVFSRDS